MNYWPTIKTVTLISNLVIDQACIFCYIFRVCCIGLDMFWFNVINGTVAVSSHQTTDARLCFAFDYMSVSIYAFMLSLIFILVFRSESPSNLPCTRMCFLGVF